MTYQVEAHLFAACALEGRSLLSTLEAGHRQREAYVEPDGYWSRLYA